MSELLLRNLGAWSLQVAVLALAAALFGRLTPVERPRARLVLTEFVLLLALVLPLLQPRRLDQGSASVVTTPGGLASPAAATQAAAAPWFPPWTLLTTLLALGVVVQLSRLCFGLVQVRAVLRSARPFEPPPWIRALREEVAPAARLALSDEAAGPATVGFRQPTILLPSRLLALPREQQQGILLHELLHARRGDWPIQIAEALVQAVLFFHPAIHWLVTRIHVAREECVDAEVVERLGGRTAYLESLLEVARLVREARAVPAAAFLRRGHLRERVDLLLKEVLMSRMRTAAHVALTAAAGLLAVSWAASAVPLQSSKPREANVQVKDDVTAPAGVKVTADDLKLVKKANPEYPAEAKKEGVQGVFVIEVVIAKDGTIRDAHVVASAPTLERLKEITSQKGTASALEGDKRLADAAVTAVKQWQYTPILRDGKPVEAKATVTVNFKLA